MKKENTLQIGTRRELFVDPWLVDTMENCRLVMHEPREEEKVFSFDQPWEGVYSGSETLIDDGDRFRLYYRGMPLVKDGDTQECTCLAFSNDGIHWERPELDQFQFQGSKANNIVLAHQPPFSHNFMPFLDKRPGGW